MQSLLLYSFTVFASLLFVRQFIKLYFPWLFEDFHVIKRLISILQRLRNYESKNYTISHRVAENARKFGHRRFIVCNDEEWSFDEMDKWSNKCARAFRKLGLKNGDTLGLLMMNEPAFAAIWIGGIRIGATTSFLNYNLRAKSLMHCITTSGMKILVIGGDEALVEAVEQVEDELKSEGIEVFVYGPATSKLKSFTDIVDEQPFQECPGGWRVESKYEDSLCYIFTSGTTGLPKAVKMNNYKCWAGAEFTSLCSVTAEDVFYTAMPLYHSAASMIGLAGAILSGCTFVIRKKFSASHFWSDCRKYNVTIAQYVGETLRYVCNQPTTPDDRDHRVRAVVGNGLRPDVWKTFLDRYGPDIHVLEFYAATEGNIGYFNTSNKFGCVGTCSPLMQLLTSGAIVKYDVAKDKLVLDSKGRAIRAANDEPGLLLGKITKDFPISEYKGKASLTEKKILQNVFKDGDKYFNTGDLMKITADYRVQFCDRIGDTFRWKGENVSTNEVGDTIAQAAGIKQANAYGVQVPNCDGRAGMVAVVLDDDIPMDWKLLYGHVCDALPSYARPIFVRVQPEIEITGTVKQRKVNLQSEGYSLSMAGDNPIYFLDHKSKSYVKLTEAMEKDVDNGVIRV